MTYQTVSDWALAVDFGTSNTSAAYIDLTSGEIRTLPLTNSGNLMPSAAFVTPLAQVDVGEVALNKAADNPRNFIAAPKRFMSAGQSAFYLETGSMQAHLVVAAILRSALARALSHRGGRSPVHLVLTHPEGWTDRQVRLLVAAAEHLGYPPAAVRTVSEPRAAAHYYANRTTVAPGDQVAVFDFGGGTLDTAVLSAGTDGSFQVLAAQGDNTLGGRNFDAEIRRWVFGELQLRNAELLSELQDEHSSDYNRLLHESIRQAKEVLSETSQAGIEVVSANHREVVLLTRPQFESIITQEILRASTLAGLTLRAAGIETNRLKALYLTGGSSRIPLIQRSLQTLGPVATLDDPKIVVAQGALMAVYRTAAVPSRPGLLDRSSLRVAPEAAASPVSHREGGWNPMAFVAVAAGLAAPTTVGVVVATGISSLGFLSVTLSLVAIALGVTAVRQSSTRKLRGKVLAISAMVLASGPLVLYAVGLVAIWGRSQHMW
ncbi:MAG: Hsp70 family protein [Mycobacteriaceae bacterium]|nr:Hsp70 family protein [Mycobacteriaceae bacterium]